MSLRHVKKSTLFAAKLFIKLINKASNSRRYSLKLDIAVRAAIIKNRLRTSEKLCDLFTFY